MSFKLVRTCAPALRALVYGIAILSAAAGQGIAADSTGGEPKLLLLPIVVHSSEDPEYLRNGLSDMLTSRFSRIGGLELIREEGLDSGTTDLEEALEEK